MVVSSLLLFAVTICAEPSTASLTAAAEGATVIHCSLVSNGAPQVFTLKSAAEVSEFVKLLDFSERAGDRPGASGAAMFWVVKMESNKGKTVDFVLIGDTQVLFGPGGEWITSLRSTRLHEWLTKKVTPVPPPPPSTPQPRLFKLVDNYRSTEDVKSLGRHQIAIGKDQLELFVSEDGTSSLSFYNRSKEAGIVKRYQVFQDSLVPHKLDGAKPIVGLVPPLSIALSDNGHLLYVLSAKSNNVICFKRNLRVGGWNPDLPVAGPAAIEALRDPQSLAVTGDGNDILVVSRSGLLHTLRRDDSTKKIAMVCSVNLVGELRTGNKVADEAIWNLAINSKGTQVYAISSTGLLVALNRDQDGKWKVAQVLHDKMPGELKSRGLVDATSIAIHPAGSRLFVVSSQGTVGVWSRNQDSGELSFDRVFAHEKLRGAVQVSVSRLEERLLVVSEKGNSVSELARQSGGEVLLLKVYESPHPVSLGFANPTTALSTADDRYVYVGSDENTLSVLGLIDDETLRFVP